MADNAKGKAKHLGGKIREEAGELLGDREMQRKGQLDQAEGVAEQDAARAQEQLREAETRRAAAERLKKD